MKNLNLRKTFLLSVVIFASLNCERDLSEDVVEAGYATTAEIFTDTPIAMGANFYFPYGGSKTTAWSIDTDVSYQGAASMRFDVPNSNDPNGNFAGAIFRVDGAGRDLRGYDALTFWAKSSQGVNIAEFGFGEDFGANKYMATITNVTLGTTWTKYIIPIPDASKLIQERGMFRYAAGTQNTGGFGYTFWIDDLKFEKLNTIGQLRPQILSGNSESITSVIGGSTSLNGFTATFNLPTGQDITVNTAPSYFSFNVTPATVATVNELGNVGVIGSGNATVTATLAGVEAVGQLNIQSIGAFTAAPLPTENPNQVISIFSDAYTNRPVDFLTSNYQPFQTTTSSNFVVNGDNVLNYLNYNFVGIEFNQNVPTIDASLMSTLHFDIFVPGTIPSGSTIRLKLRNLGANGVVNNDFNGNPTGDDTEINYVVGAPALISGNWISVDFNITGLANRSQLGVIVFDSVSGIAPSSFFVDNIYFFNNGTIIAPTPTVAAPIPTVPASNVISLFSNAYTNVAGSDLNPNWGQNTQVTQVSIAGNNTLRYGNLNYQGLQIGTPQNVSGMTHLHLDYYTSNSSSLRVFLISPGPVERDKILNVPTASGWNSIDIPLTDFSPVNLANIIQLKFEGNGNIYLDNIYFKN